MDVGQETEVYLDSGIRSGQDVLKAIALGAKGCLIGRAFIYGLGAYGEQGVYKVLDIIKKELDGVKVLGNGAIEKKLTVQAAKFSKSAVAAIEAAAIILRMVI